MNAPPPLPPTPTPTPNSTPSLSSPRLQSHLSFNLLPHATPSPSPSPSPPLPLTRIKLSDITPYEGACYSDYQKAVDALSSSLTRHNAAVIELVSTGEDVAVMRCALESVRMFFKAKEQGLMTGGEKRSRGVYIYRAGRSLEDGDIYPPCMSEVFRHLGKAARIALSAIARHLRLRTDAFSDLLDDTPLSPNEVSSSRLVASFSNCAVPNGKMPDRCTIDEIEKGFVTLIVSDHPGIQVCDPNGHWYLADADVGPGNMLLLTGKALSHCTAGLRPAPLYRTSTGDSCSSSSTISRASLMFKLMPKSNAVLDCSRIISVGHCIPQSYQPISASQLTDELLAEDDMVTNQPEKTPESHTNLPREPSLLSVLSDSSSGAFLEDAMVVSCGHSFGGQTLKKVIEMAKCAICNAEIEPESLIPNIALRAAATVVKVENGMRLDHIANLRKRRREEGEQINAMRHFSKDNSETSADLSGFQFFQGAHFPFSVNEKVLIKGNRRTPEKFVGREAIITSQCLNGWFLLKILDTGESVRLQYRSLKKLSSSQASNEMGRHHTC
ncbi:RING/U-box superfamily protein [Carex rostrata]